MAITSSAFAVGVAQKDGRVWITETHTDTFAGQLTFSYLDASANATAVMNARVTRIVEQLAATEADNLIDNAVTFVLQQNTAAQFAARFRARYLNSSGQECARLATWILDRIDAGTFTDTQVRIAFGLTAVQYTTLKTKMTSLRTAYNTAVAAQGE